MSIRSKNVLHRQAAFQWLSFMYKPDTELNRVITLNTVEMPACIKTLRNRKAGSSPDSTSHDIVNKNSN